jgi:hypothetical protein
MGDELQHSMEHSIPSRKIPSSGEPIPELGMGTWKSFDVPEGPARNPLKDILRDSRHRESRSPGGKPGLCRGRHARPGTKGGMGSSNGSNLNPGE